MDPTACLAEIRRIIARCAAGETWDAERLVDLAEALDGWISRGGFLPTQWADAARCAQQWTGPAGNFLRCTKAADHTGPCHFGVA